MSISTLYRRSTHQLPPPKGWPPEHDADRHNDRKVVIYYQTLALPIQGVLKMSRLFFLILGHVFMGLGAIGIVLPILPTTPFLILACGCYGRSSERFQQFLLSNRWSGPLLRNWKEEGTISSRTKCTALLLMSGAITYSVISIPLLGLKIGLVLTAVGVSTYIITRPPSRTQHGSSAANPLG